MTTRQTDDGERRRPPSTRARIVLWTLVVVVLVHTGLIALWVGPTTPVREAVGVSTLRGYVMPVFEQNWRIFAPTPRRIAVELDVRAQVLDPVTGEETTTDWVHLVAGEDELIRGNPFPPRMALAARRTANHLINRADDMNAEQRRQVEAHYLTTPVAELRGRLLDAEGDSPAGPSAVASYMRYDAVATALASYYFTHTLDGEVTHVQYRATRRFTPSFAQRGERDIDDAERTVFDFGWRQAVDVEPGIAELVAPYADAQEQAR